MYHVTLHIHTAGIPDAMAEEWKSISPLPRFFHAFAPLTDLADLKNGASEVVILGADAPFTAEEVRAAIGEKGVLVLWAAPGEAVPEEALAVADDCWVCPDAAAAAFHFRKLLENIKERKDAWLCYNYWQSSINMLPDMVWYKDMQGLHLEVNDEFCHVVGKDKDDVRGKDHYYIWGIPREVYEKSDYVCVETEDDVIRARKTCVFDEEVMAEDGLRKLKTYKTPVFEEDGSIIGTIGIARDVTQAYRDRQTILDLAFHDSLTQLDNRTSLRKHLKEFGTGPAVMALFDMDFFKKLNDTRGHQAGDDVLKMVGRLAKEHFPEALNVRYGGDEFLSLFFRVEDEENVLPQLLAFREALDTYFHGTVDAPFLGVSMGVSSGTIQDGSLETLFRECDRALYAAKGEGKDRLVRYGDIRER